jgi:hypothetical protein
MLAYTALAQEKLRRTFDGIRPEIESVTATGPMQVHISPAETVSIIVHPRNVAVDEMEGTLTSCLNQTYREVDVLLVTDSLPVEGLPAWITDDRRFRVLAPGNKGADWLMAGLAAASGEYVTWLDTGAVYADDALSIMLNALENNPDASLVHADYFLSSGGIIEWKASLGRFYAPEQATRPGPCLLVRRDDAEKLWQDIRVNSPGTILKNWKAIYLRHPLFFEPASAGLRYFYRGLLAFGRGNLAAGQRLLAMAGADLEAELADRSHRTSLVELIAATARQALTVDKAQQFAELFFGNLPDEAKRLRLLKRKVVAYLAVRQMYEAHPEKGFRATLRSFWKGTRNDPSWLRNRGLWVVLARSFAGALAAFRRPAPHSAVPVEGETGVS